MLILQGAWQISVSKAHKHCHLQLPQLLCPPGARFRHREDSALVLKPNPWDLS